MSLEGAHYYCKNINFQNVGEKHAVTLKVHYSNRKELNMSR